MLTNAAVAAGRSTRTLPAWLVRGASGRGRHLPSPPTPAPPSVTPEVATRDGPVNRCTLAGPA